MTQNQDRRQLLKQNFTKLYLKPVEDKLQGKGYYKFLDKVDNWVNNKIDNKIEDNV